MIPRPRFTTSATAKWISPRSSALPKTQVSKHYFVEQDETPGDPIESLRKSFQYLESLS